MNAPRIEWDNRITTSDLIQIALVLILGTGILWRQSAWQAKTDIVQTQQTDTLAKIGAESHANAGYITTLDQELKAFKLHLHADHKIIFPDGTIQEMPK